MITNYLFYLNGLTNEEKLEQLSIMLVFFLIVFTICGILKFLQLKLMDENKDSLFQKFLKKL